MEINDWTNNSDNTDFNQDLNIQDVLEFNIVININGVINIKTLIIIYLKEYENNKFNKPNDVKLFIIPSKEKTFNVVPE